MKKMTVKLSDLHKFFGMFEYEKEFILEEDIFIEQIDQEYVKVNALVLKKTLMLESIIEGIEEPYVCAEKHIIMSSTGWKHMIDADEVLDKDGISRRVLQKKQIGEQDAYDVGLDAPHTYITRNGLIHHNTFVACYRAIEEVLQKDNSFERVVIVRSAVQTRDSGYVPGDLNEKNEIYEQPYKEIFSNLFGRNDAYERLKEQGYIRFITTTAIRGISVDDAIIIVDESQSMQFHELNQVISRTGHRSKVIFAGDLKQNDLIKSKHDVSGLADFLKIAKTMPEYQDVTFTPDDIVRSSLVKSWIIACEKLGF